MCMVGLPPDAFHFFNSRIIGTAIGSPTFITPWAKFIPCGSHSAFEHAHHIQPFADGFFRADQGAASTAVAQFREDQCLFANDGDGVKLANLGALPAMCASRLIHHRKEDADFLAGIECRIEEECGIGSFHVAIHKTDGFPACISARLVATVVLPVPPFPLATTIRISDGLRDGLRGWRLWLWLSLPWL